ncbi:hypothetical protein BRYFOR_05323 [Marvinbryantia formatexigens DSM 14469]|uniref:Alcohol acetyltransferase n=4 Tax=Marvinbryantia TaxID=248744 RepID=C6L9N3_9FIRM|nr:hypothetical protein BRYFOR_05323 [Marvinbryantia formatexigens DSM 14469]
MKLDSSGNLYPAIATREYPQIYRISIALVTPVLPALLKQAVKETLPAFPAFHVCLKRERFWYYLENSDKLPEITRQKDKGIRPFPEKGLQFRFLYEKNWIHLETFHALTDGTGAIHFLHAVCYRYCQLAYRGLLSRDVLEKRYGLEGAENIRDAYQSFGTKSGRPWKLLKKSPAFRICGKKQPQGNVVVYTGQLSLTELKEACRKYHATVCELLTAISLYALWQEYREKAVQSRRRFRVAIPVNLRPFFQKKTEKNFFTCIPIEADPEEYYTLERLIGEVKRQFSDKCSENYLRSQVAGQVTGQQSLVSRYAPVVLKNWFLKTMYRYNGYSTMVLSNLGKMQPRKEFASCIIGYRCVLPVTGREPVKIAVCSYRDTIELTVTSNLAEEKLQETVFGLCARLGISMEIQKTGIGGEWPAEKKSGLINQKQFSNRRKTFPCYSLLSN